MLTDHFHLCFANQGHLPQQVWYFLIMHQLGDFIKENKDKISLKKARELKSEVKREEELKIWGEKDIYMPLLSCKKQSWFYVHYESGEQDFYCKSLEVQMLST